MKKMPVLLPSDKAQLEGALTVPGSPRGIVLFAHGSGSSRLSPRNQFVAESLNQASLATLLFDLLTTDEEEIDQKTLEYRFDIEFLAKRLMDATHWVSENPLIQHLPLGYFGASTGAGAALVAAAQMPAKTKAVVSRGGRPDLAEESLSRVKAPVLLIVGEEDAPVIQMNRSAMEHMQHIVELEIVPKATHLFEEPGALEAVAKSATDWFLKYLIM